LCHIIPFKAYAKLYYTTTHLDPLGIVTAMPFATEIGPTDIADEPLGIE
jgi:hypothetical protein